jgi:hypothetical protein
LAAADLRRPEGIARSRATTGIVDDQKRTRLGVFFSRPIGPLEPRVSGADQDTSNEVSPLCLCPRPLSATLVHAIARTKSGSVIHLTCFDKSEPESCDHASAATLTFLLSRNCERGSRVDLHGSCHAGHQAHAIRYPIDVDAHRHALRKADPGEDRIYRSEPYLVRLRHAR